MPSGSAIRICNASRSLRSVAVCEDGFLSHQRLHEHDAATELAPAERQATDHRVRAGLQRQGIGLVDFRTHAKARRIPEEKNGLARAARRGFTFAPQAFDDDTVGRRAQDGFLPTSTRESEPHFSRAEFDLAEAGWSRAEAIAKQCAAELSHLEHQCARRISRWGLAKREPSHFTDGFDVADTMDPAVRRFHGGALARTGARKKQAR